MADERLIPLFDVQAGRPTRSRPWRPRCARAGSRWARAPRTSRRRSPSTSARSHAIALSSCTAALHLAYLAAGVGPGDEVIVPAITFVASANAVRYCGATPVIADVVGQHDLGLDPDDVAARITPRTKAVCAVHYGGYAADVEALGRLCEEHGLALIEDAAHTPSATPVGSDRKLGHLRPGGRLQLLLQQGALLRRGRAARRPTTTRVAEQVRSLRSHAMTSGTWDRHRGHSAGYDVRRPRLQLPDGRAARRAAHGAPRGPRGRHRPAPRARAPLPAAARRRAGPDACPTATTRWTPPPAT